MVIENTGLRTIRAANPGPMTGTGTNSYVLSAGDDCMIIDPGPDLPDHMAALTAAVGGRRLRGIIVTHAHLDHSQSAAILGLRLDSPTLAFGGAHSGRSPVMARLADAGLVAGPEGLDTAFQPDQVLQDGQAIAFGDGEIGVLHSPGHLGGHICLEWAGNLFCGDHVMGWSSSFVSPPDGDMAAYMTSLRRLRELDRWRGFLPGHGDAVTQPRARLEELITHRERREAAILSALTHGPRTAEVVTAEVYTDTPRALLGAARRNVLAHLIALWEAGEVATDAPLTENSVFARVHKSR